jgi:histidine ammonia-lyase
LRRPLASGRGTHAAHDVARRVIAPWGHDRPPAPDIAAARQLIASGELTRAAEAASGAAL